MNPCIICGTYIKKKDSVMKIDYVCSETCKVRRKEILPKKLSVVSKQYWINQGMTDDEAEFHVSKIQSERSPRRLEYWLKKGFSHDEAARKVSEVQRNYSLNNLEKYTHLERQERTPFSEKYWIRKGYNEVQAKEILSKQADGTSLDFYISKYGEIEGARRYDEMCRLRQSEYTLAGFQRKHGKENGELLWSKKFKNRHNSKKASDFFRKLLFTIGDKYKIYTAHNEYGEYGVLDSLNNEYYFYDFVVPDLKLCIEFHGDYWHCNPSKYDALYEHKQVGKTAQEIWKQDEIKINTIKQQRGFDVIVVWESDDLTEKLNNIMEKFNEFEKNKN